MDHLQQTLARTWDINGINLGELSCKCQLKGRFRVR